MKGKFLQIEGHIEEYKVEDIIRVQGGNCAVTAYLCTNIKNDSSLIVRAHIIVGINAIHPDKRV